MCIAQTEHGNVKVKKRPSEPCDFCGNAASSGSRGRSPHCWDVLRCSFQKKKRGEMEGAEISNPPESAKKPLMMTANQQKQQQSAGLRPRHLRRCELSVGGKKDPSSPRPPPPAAETGRGASWAHGSLDTGQRAVAARRDRGGCGRSDFSCVSGPVVTTRCGLAARG